jgi:DNA ligase (NAD+)
MISRKPSYKDMSHEIAATQLISALKNGQNVSESKDVLIKAQDAYYNYGISIMPDHVYDALEQALKQIIPNDDYFKKVGIKVRVTEWKKVAHKISMKSLNKVNSVEEFEKWVSDCGTDDLVMEDKLDGGSVDLEYENGILVHAITRGDGIEGEDIVNNVKNMQGVKSKIDGLSGSLRGEIFILANDFEKINSIKMQNGVKELSNPRNGAVGVCKGYDGEFTEYLTIYFYDVESDALYFKTEDEKMEYLKSLGLKICFCKRVTAQQAIKIFEDYEDHLRNETPYMIDGMVLKVNDNELLDNLGLTGANYKGQVAWKFEAVKAETILENVEWSLGSNRRITPVANFKEVQVGGVRITNATLHNLDNFKEKKPGKGDRILISRRNDVIPAIESIIESKGNYFQIPQNCPICGHQTEVEGAYLICPNDLCQGLALGNLGRWINALKIMDIGDNIIEALYKAKRIATPADFYRLITTDISTLERLGERSAVKILAHLKEKMEIDLPMFIDGLNIRNFGSRTAETLVEAGFDTIEKMQNATIDNLITVKGIQTKTAEAISSGLLNKKEIIADLLSVGITFKIKDKIQVKGNTLQGKSFCFTGAINRIDDNGKRYSREMMHKLVVENGGTVEEAVKKGLSFLVMADPNSVSSKAQKARQIGTEVLSESDFFKKLGM